MKWYAKTLLNCIYSRYAEVKGALKMYKYKQYSKPKKTYKNRILMRQTKPKPKKPKPQTTKQKKTDLGLHVWPPSQNQRNHNQKKTKKPKI